MFLGIGAWVLLFVGIITICLGIASGDNLGVVVGIVLGTVILMGGYWMQTHGIVRANYVGVARNSITQEFTEMQDAGLIDKPFFGTVYLFPASTDYEICHRYYPPIAGSYEVLMDVCPYIDLSSVDWVQEIKSTGTFNSDEIMAIWMKGLTIDISTVVSDKTPLDMNTQVQQIEAGLYESTKTWFDKRGVVINRVVFEYWDFSSEAVATAYDESIGVQRQVQEQDALLKIAEKERILELYQADTARQVSLFNMETLQLVSTEQLEAAENAGISEEQLLEWLWMNYFRDSGTAPDYMILGGSNSEPAIAVSP